MEEDEEEEGDDDNMIIRGFAEYSAFDDTAMGEAEEEVAAEEQVAAEDEPDVVKPSVMHKENAKVTRRRSSLSAC